MISRRLLNARVSRSCSTPLCRVARAGVRSPGCAVVPTELFPQALDLRPTVQADRLAWDPALSVLLEDATGLFAERGAMRVSKIVFGVGLFFLLITASRILV